MAYPEPFADFPQESLRRRDMAPGDVLFRQNENSSGLWWVDRGAVQLTHQTDTGHVVGVGRAGAGQIVAEGSLFAPVYAATANVTAAGRAVRFRKQPILRRFDSDPAFARALLQFFARQIDAQRQHADVLSLRAAEDRVVTALALEGQTGTVMALAAHIGITHEAAYRALRRLVAAGAVIKTGRGRYALAPA